MDSGKAFPDSLAAALADGAAVDWRAVEAASRGSANADLVRQLRVIAAMRSRPAAEKAGEQPWLRQAVVACYSAGVTLAGTKVLLALLGAPAALAHLAPAAIWPFVLNLVAFGAGGLLLVAGGVRDLRLRLLGGFYLTIASAFVDPFVPQLGGPPGSVVNALRSCPTEAFGALGIWLFASAFPGEPKTVRARRLSAAFVIAACAVSSLLFTANVLRGQHVWPIVDSSAVAVLDALNRNSATQLYWPLLFTLSIPALPFLLAKGRLETLEKRRKVTLFLSALGLGLAPMLVAVIATPVVPALGDPAVRERVGVVLYLALASIVPATAYAVAVDRVMDLQFVVRATLQYALARYAIWGVIVGPLTYLAVDIFANRDLTILRYLEGRQPLGVLALSGVGLVALTFRPQLVRAVDRWFLREPLDYSQTMARVEHRFRTAENLREISRALSEELSRALHADRVTVMLMAEDGVALVALDGSTPAIAADSVLLELLRSMRGGMRIDVRTQSPVVRLLPEADRDWLADSGTQLLSPLMGSSDALLGIVAIGEGRNALPYTLDHLTLVTAMSGHAAMQIENRWLRHAQPGRGRVNRAGKVDWQNEPAACCPSCSEVWSPETLRCRCGAATKPAALPVLVNGKFHLQRLIGVGGTGVVYLAVDVALDRKVAIKTLPAMRREYAVRLRREARAMAAVLHPNLAMIYGTEEWHDTPLLVVEYLDGGTLLDWLRRGPASVDETIDLGIVLADVLDRIHASGVLHRDIKPSNIGYTADGLLKLLDFGLAAMLDRSKGADAAAAVLPADPAELAAKFHDVKASSTVTITQQLVGTPLYLSPEAIAGSPPREAFDLWSLSMVLYESLAGRHPFGGGTVTDVVRAIQYTSVPDVRDVRPDCPAPLAALLNDALSRVEGRRPATAAAVRAQLQGLRSRLRSTTS